MSALTWGAWGAEWELAEKVSFNGTTKQITVNAGVTALDIRTEVYSAWIRWVAREENSRFLPAMRVSGADPFRAVKQALRSSCKAAGSWYTTLTL